MDAEIRTFTRDELYEAVWSTPGSTLAESLNISDVALAKRCRRLGIPRPSRGYWARVAAGEKPKQSPLPPPLKGQDRIVRFDLTVGSRRRREWAETTSRQHELLAVAPTIELPDPGAPLHPLAERYQKALEKAKPDSDGFIRLHRKNLFACHVSPAVVPKLCRAIDALIRELEARGYKLQAGKNRYDNLNIVNGGDSLSISLSESCEEVNREPTAEDKRKPSWTWDLKASRPTGHLRFEVCARDLRGKRAWAEGPDRPLSDVLGIIAEKVEWVFRGYVEARKQAAEWEKRRKEEERRQEAERVNEARRRQELEKRKRHEARLAEIVTSRREQLILAACQWQEANLLLAFRAECERRWRGFKGGVLSEEQEQWLAWARTEAARLDPFDQGYPDPESDGPFEPASVPMGGPYLATRQRELQRESEEIESSVRREESVAVPNPEPFPFWYVRQSS